MNDAAKSDPKALKTLLSLIDRHARTPEAAVDMNALAAEDQSILTSYMNELKGLGASDAENSTEETNNSIPGGHDAHSG